MANYVRICILLFIAVASAFADAEPSITNNIYFGGSIGYGQTQLARPTVATTFERDGFIWSALMGYQLPHHFATEMGYVRMKNVIAAVTSQDQSAKDTIEPWFSYLAIKKDIPVNKTINIIMKLGGAYVKGKEYLETPLGNTVRSQHAIVPYGALGLGFVLQPQLTLSLEAMKTLKHGSVPGRNRLAILYR